jgi:hypothetical protein
VTIDALAHPAQRFGGICVPRHEGIAVGYIQASPGAFRQPNLVDRDRISRDLIWGSKHFPLALDDQRLYAG